MAGPGRPPGLPKTGGRKPGGTNRRTEQFMDVLAKHNFCPATAMIEIYNEARKIYDGYGKIYEAIVEAKSEASGYPVPVEDKADKYLKIAGDMAKEISSYAYAKRKAIEQIVDPALLEKIQEFEGKSNKELLAILKTVPDL